MVYQNETPASFVTHTYTSSSLSLNFKSAVIFPFPFFSVMRISSLYKPDLFTAGNPFTFYMGDCRENTYIYIDTMWVTVGRILTYIYI